MRRPEHPGEASICIGCGFCCDGTLHGHADLAAGEESHALALGLRVERRRDRLIFRQPCPKFGGGRCSIYAERPEPCRGYRCKLRKDVDEGRLGAAQARDKIETVKALIAVVKSRGAWADTPARRTTLWRELEDSLGQFEGEERGRRARAILDIAALDFYLDRWFRRKTPAGDDSTQP